MAKVLKSRPSRPVKPKKAAGDGLWDRPPLLNLLADVLYVAAAAGLLYAAAVGAQRLPFFPLRQVVVQGELHQVTRMQVEYAVRGAVNGNFFTVNLDAVRASFEKLPWVRRADVRRIWPDRLELTIEEQQAVARWRQADGGYRLVNSQGEVFVAATEAALPTFAGPEGSAGDMLARHREFSASLESLGRHPVELQLSPRQAWQVKLDDGLVLNLGREENQKTVSERMARFVTAYHQIRDGFHLKPSQIDMRYPNGFALRATAGEPS